MAKTIHLLPEKFEFVAESGESILRAALRAGQNVNHGCINGSCGRCLVRLRRGEVNRLRPHDFIISEADKASGGILMCSNSPISDIEIEADTAHRGDDIPLQKLTVKVRRCEQVDDNTLILRLRTQRTKLLRFMAGQHATLLLKGGLQRELPIASCPCDGLNLEFHLHKEASDSFTNYIFSQLKTNEKLVIHGPSGNFTLETTDPAPVLFIAWGTGFAPIHSLIENCLSLELSQPIIFYWIVHEQEVHYADGYCRAVNDAIDNFTYQPLLTETAAEAIAEIVQQQPNLSGWRAYIAAPPAIIDNTIEALSKCALDPKKIKSDSVVA